MTLPLELNRTQRDHVVAGPGVGRRYTEGVAQVLDMSQFLRPLCGIDEHCQVGGTSRRANGQRRTSVNLIREIQALGMIGWGAENGHSVPGRTRWHRARRCKLAGCAGFVRPVRHSQFARNRMACEQ